MYQLECKYRKEHECNNTIKHLINSKLVTKFSLIANFKVRFSYVSEENKLRCYVY